MATVFTTTWRHVSFPTGSNGLIFLTAGGQDFGTHAISGGGFAEVETSANSNSTDEFGNDASGMVPIVGMRRDYDSGTDTTYWIVAFAAAPNTWLRCHLFAVTAAEVS